MVVVSMIKRWPPWSPTQCKKFQVTVVVKSLKGLNKCLVSEFEALFVEVKWKGQKGIGLKRLVKKNLTQIGSLNLDDDCVVVEWDEEFKSFCSFSAYKNGVFYPWEVKFTLFNGLTEEPKSNIPAIGTISVNLAKFASVAQDEALEINIPVNLTNIAMESCPTLCLSLHLVEQRVGQEFADVVSFPDENSAPRRGLFKAKTFKSFASSQKRVKTSSEEESSDYTSSPKSDDVGYDFETDSFDENPEGESEESKEELSIKTSFAGETLLYARCAQALHPAAMADVKDEAWIYYSYRISDERCSNVDNSSIDVPKKSSWLSPKQSFLFWRKRKLSFKSAKVKGEPLLKSYYGQEGGDDIDYDRRQFSTSDESISGKSDGSTTSDSEFGDDVFVVGSWELKNIASRDGQMKLQTPVFSASIDQMSERAAGESACTALVVVIADWLQSNRYIMPIKSEFDSLIRDGSSEWRNLCENETYLEQFPDKHFDLETILEARVRPLTVVHEKSFIGFFHPEGLEDGDFDFLHGVMSFDSIWEEISRHGSECSKLGEPLVYIVSWNDHFFVLKVEEDAYYIIDTLGERLYEGCDQAYILKFDKDTRINKLLTETSTSDEKSAGEKVPVTSSKKISSEATLLDILDMPEREESEEALYSGKESCKEYIKSFLAAIPIRELQADIKKGLKASTRLHHQLQIEFHYTRSSEKISGNPVKEATVDTPAIEIETDTAREATKGS